MFKELYHIALRECGIMWKNPIYLFCMVIFPIVVVIFFTTLMKGGVPTDMPVGIVDQDNSATSRQLVHKLEKETVQIAQCEGEVSNVYPKVGELVGLGSPIMSISIMSDMWGTFNVREDHLKGLNKGDEFTAYVPAFNKDIKMKVYYLKDQGSYATWKATKDNGDYDRKTFEVKARPITKIEGLRPGMSLVIK